LEPTTEAPVTRRNHLFADRKTAHHEAGAAARKSLTESFPVNSNPQRAVMVAAVQTTVRKAVRIPHEPHQTACDWQVLGRFDTLEPAEAALEQWRGQGINAQLQMVDGLTVIGPRPERSAS
jgi:hypothetical protein